jgi:AraC-like DNA-binding protein
MRARPDYRRYLLNSPESETWGIAVTAGGRQACRAGSPYPPAGHPSDHAFTWDNGRVLGACQVVFIAAGSGVFESKSTGQVPVAQGSAIVVFPGVWHRYRPDPKTGWSEQWIELQGRALDAVLAKGLLEPARAVVPLKRHRDLGRILDRIQDRLSEPVPGFDAEAAALGLQALSLLVEAPRLHAAKRSITGFVERAERILTDAVDRPPAIPAVARDLGVAYSYFRREFKRHTGLAPYQYVRRLRLDKARRMIGGTSESLQAISEKLGFASAYHLSAAFKKEFGQAPGIWRGRHK